MPAPHFEPGDVLRLPDGKTRRFLGTFQMGPGEPQALWESLVPRQKNHSGAAYEYPAELGPDEYTFHCNLSEFKAWARHATVVQPTGSEVARKLIADFDAQWADASEEPEMDTVWDLLNNIESTLGNSP